MMESQNVDQSSPMSRTDAASSETSVVGFGWSILAPEVPQMVIEKRTAPKLHRVNESTVGACVFPSRPQLMEHWKDSGLMKSSRATAELPELQRRCA